MNKISFWWQHPTCHLYFKQFYLTMEVTPPTKPRFFKYSKEPRDAYWFNRIHWKI